MSEPIRVVVSGSGKMGRAIIDAVDAADGDDPVGVIEKFVEGASTAPGRPARCPITADPEEAFASWNADVVIDFTNAAWTPAVVDAALAHGVRPVIGTSGVGEHVRRLSRGTLPPNSGSAASSRRTSRIGAVLLMHMAAIAAKFFDSAEIIELHHDQKVDAPSGTAIATARAMARGARPAVRAQCAGDADRSPARAPAAIEGVTVHSLRLPGLVAHQEVIFGGQGQTLTLRHDSIGRDSFMPGIVLAVREVMHREELVVGLDALIGLA